jgi:hypothetical protein
MAIETMNDKLAAQVGQDKTFKDGAYAYDRVVGTYCCTPAPKRALDQAKSTVTPFRVNG